MAAHKGNKYALGNLGGRPSPYELNPGLYNSLVQQFAFLNYKDEQIAEMLDVDLSTLNLWKIKHKKFSEAYKNGKFKRISKIGEAFYQKCVGGQKVTEIKQIKEDGAVVREEITERELPPDTTAQIFALKARAGWSDKSSELQIDVNVSLLEQAHERTQQALDMQKWLVIDEKDWPDDVRVFYGLSARNEALSSQAVIDVAPVVPSENAITVDLAIAPILIPEKTE